MSFDKLSKLTQNEFNALSELLSESLLAGYLLGYDSSREIHAPILKAARQAKKAEFASGDLDDKSAEKGGLLDLRFDVPPEEAVDYFKRKKVVTKKTYKDLADDAKAAAFTVGGVYKKTTLEAFRSEIESALANGTPQAEVIKNFKNILNGAGNKMLGDFHLETIFRTNIQIAYGVGRRQQMEEVKEDLPYWQYNAIIDGRTRRTHAALDGVVLRYDNPFWDDHYPPWDFNCRCNATATYETPDGYDPKKPNANSTIVYDDEGVPRKAEYGTNVVDLSAGKFVGVPRQNVGLRDSILNANAQ